VVLIAGDYGFHTGNLLWRAHFTASGGETAFSANVTGGTAFGFSAWLDSNFIGSWEGDSLNWIYEKELKFPAALAKGSKHVITILQVRDPVRFVSALSLILHPRTIWGTIKTGGLQASNSKRPVAFSSTVSSVTPLLRLHHGRSPETLAANRYVVFGSQNVHLLRTNAVYRQGSRSSERRWSLRRTSG